MPCSPKITTTYDDFRDPKVLRGTEKHRQLPWLYRENRTDLLKVQRTASWKVPQEPVKTYSLLGFQPIAAFTVQQSAVLSNDNTRAHATWENPVRDHGHGIDHIHVGWLRPMADGRYGRPGDRTPRIAAAE